MTQQRAFGFHAEESGQHDHLCGVNRDASEHLGDTVSLSNEALALTQFLPKLKLQKNTPTCVLHGITNAAEIRLKSQKIDVEPSSIRAGYTLANQLLRVNRNDPVKNDGTYARVAMEACADFGVATEAEWPLWDANGEPFDLTKEVPPHVLQRASSWKLKEQFTITQRGQARIDACCQALAQLYPLPVAGRVDTTFCNHRGDGILPAPDPREDQGGHMTCAIGFRTNAAGRREFLILNSWADWGLDGSIAWASEEWLLSLQEIYAFTLTHGRRI